MAKTFLKAFSLLFCLVAGSGTIGYLGYFLFGDAGLIISTVVVMCALAALVVTVMTHR
jgi:hypothetical protein